jgi:hypothetical protein
MIFMFEGIILSLSFFKESEDTTEILEMFANFRAVFVK